MEIDVSFQITTYGGLRLEDTIAAESPVHKFLELESVHTQRSGDSESNILDFKNEGFRMDVYAYVMLERFKVKWARFRPEFVSEGMVTLSERSMEALRKALAEREEEMAGRYGESWSDLEEQLKHGSDESEISDGWNSSDEPDGESVKNTERSTSKNAS